MRFFFKFIENSICIVNECLLIFGTLFRQKTLSPFHNIFHKTERMNNLYRTERMSHVLCCLLLEFCRTFESSSQTKSCLSTHTKNMALLISAVEFQRSSHKSESSSDGEKLSSVKCVHVWQSTNTDIYSIVRSAYCL